MPGFITITQDEYDEKLAESLRSRELELLGYQFENEGHQKAIADLGDIQWDETTVEYKTLGRDEMIKRALANGLSKAQIEHISKLQALDKHRTESVAVEVESAKSRRHYDNVLVALPEGPRRDAAIAKILAKEAKQKGEVVETPKEEIIA